MFITINVATIKITAKEDAGRYTPVCKKAPVGSIINVKQKSSLYMYLTIVKLHLTEGTRLSVR